MKSFKAFLRPIYRTIIPNMYLTELGKELKDCKNVLDLGCGSKSPISNFPKTFYAEGVEIYKPSIEQSKKKKIHDKYHNINMLNIGKKIKPKSFDCVLALDVIEHLDKDEGARLINLMEKIAKKVLIVVMPNGYLGHSNPDIEYDEIKENPHQSHKSGWSTKEMKDLEFKVIGIGGFKFLKGDCPKQIKWKPWIFWKIVSDLSALFLRNKPEWSFELYCIKKTINKLKLITTEYDYGDYQD